MMIPAIRSLADDHRKGELASRTQEKKMLRDKCTQKDELAQMLSEDYASSRNRIFKQRHNNEDNAREPDSRVIGLLEDNFKKVLPCIYSFCFFVKKQLK